jgi:hypothetical protein
VKLPLQDEHGFTDPEAAAFHACMVQGGFSTPEREAARMLLDGGIAGDRARAWMNDQDLGLLDLKWDAGQLDNYLATAPRDSWADTPHRYLVTRPGEPEREAGIGEWQAAERAAGFHAPNGYSATAGFTGINGISGRIEFYPEQEQETADDS